MKIKQNELREEINKVLENFGKLVKETRHVKKMSMTKLSEESGISQSLISDLENNKGKVPNIYTLVAIARALDFSDKTFIEKIWGNVNKNNEECNLDADKKLEQAIINYGVPLEYVESSIKYLKFLSYKSALNDIISDLAPIDPPKALQLIQKYLQNM